MITRYLEDGPTFDAETTRAMSSAFDQVCAGPGLDSDAKAREIVAIRIIELARCGMTEADALRDRVLQEAGARV